MLVVEYFEDEVYDLFQEFEAKFPSKTIGKDKWYITALAALTGGPRPENAAILYKYLIQKKEFQTSESRQALIRRLRECVMKMVPVAGAPKALEAIFAIAKIERPEDKDYSFLREGWQCDDENYRKGTEWRIKLYKSDPGTTDGTRNLFSAHRDLEWMSHHISYGLFFSDRQVLDDYDTELTVLCGIMIQNLPLESAWHIRGARRIGLSGKDLETTQECIKLIGDFFGVKLDRVPKVADIEHQV